MKAQYLYILIISIILISCSKPKIENSNIITNSPCDTIEWNTSINYGSVKDLEGNIYKTVKIGSQIWMAENLKTFKYNNGDSIFYFKENSTNSSWNGIKIGAVQSIYLSKDVYNNNPINYSTCYGNYYNYYSVEDERNICPTGWHVSTVSDWKNLYNYIDSTVLTSDFRSVIKSHNGWDLTGNGTDNVGLRILPAMSAETPFIVRTNKSADFWCFDSIDVLNFNTIHQSLTNKIVFWTSPKSNGKTIRCVKD